MKAINDLYDALRQRREQRRIYHAARDISPRLARDIGLTDHPHRRAYRV